MSPGGAARPVRMRARRWLGPASGLPRWGEAGGAGAAAQGTAAAERDAGEAAEAR